MQVFDSGKIYDFMGKRFVSFAISCALIVGSIFCLFTKGLNYGIDFSGGTLIQVKYEGRAPLENIRLALEKELSNVSVTEFGTDEEVVIRYASTSDAVSSDPGANIAKLLEGTGKYEVRRVDVVGPKVGAELREKGIMAISVSLVLILIYIAFRFEWRFALAAVLCEFHDVIVVVGAISALGLDVNLDTLAAVLTIIGYSLNDTIIVFDRIREGVQGGKSTDLNFSINESISATLSRTFMTGITTLLTVITLFLWGGDIIHGFATIMIIGIVLGTLSSIFIAAPSLVWFKFDISKYREHLAAKQRAKQEKERMRAMYEKGSV